MQFRLIALSLAVALWGAATVAAAAGHPGPHSPLDQAPSWIHKVPEFVCGRVELVSALAFDRAPRNVRANESARPAQAEIPAARGHDTICASPAFDRPASPHGRP